MPTWPRLASKSRAMRGAGQLASKMEDADPCGMGDSIRAAHSVKLLQQRCDVILGSVRRNSEPTGNQLVRRALCQQRKHSNSRAVSAMLASSSVAAPNAATTTASGSSFLPTSSSPSTSANADAIRSARAGSATSIASRNLSLASGPLKPLAFHRFEFLLGAIGRLSAARSPASSQHCRAPAISAIVATC
jgi:hypothetical protein